MADDTSAEEKTKTSSDTKNVMFLDEEVEESQEVVAPFKRASNGETLTKHQRMQNDIESCRKTSKSSMQGTLTFRYPRENR